MMRNIWKSKIDSLQSLNLCLVTFLNNMDHFKNHKSAPWMRGISSTLGLDKKEMDRVEKLRTGECAGMIEIEDFLDRERYPITIVPKE